LFFLLSTRPPLTSTLFPYTTLFRSSRAVRRARRGAGAGGRRACSWRLGIWLDGEKPGHYSRFTMTKRDLVIRISNDTNLIQQDRSEEHTSELQSRSDLVCRLLLEKK